jgi:Mlc titration factor MtfA (ptsG expression regulator)
MVGSGPMEGKMILSRKALHDGFRNEDDAHNTAIHEFVHLIDKMDGEIDGIPSLLLEKQYTLPWLALMDEYIQKIRGGKSEFNPYAGTNREEFFAELSVYFFEKPKELKLDHPELYHVLEQVFQQKMSKQKQVLAHATRRNDPCPCGSGKKFKHCCGN